ncbi:hypothetical protein AB0F20_10350 [Streptomyces goshikiensis]|uniref:hypothetical protein n=1 Tax=Streptomyces goshikiensis TaxID=1942 RepID=UPI0033DEEAF2
MIATHPTPTAPGATPEPITGILRGERTEVNSIFDDQGRNVVRDFSYVHRNYFVTGAPDIHDSARRYLMRPTGVFLSWARMNTEAWELRAVKVHGVRVLKSGRAGAEVPHISLLMRDVPQWLHTFAEAHSPAS